jgi:hypothetical protein
VDTSNEIAGNADQVHKCIGKARRIQVPDRMRQHEKLIEAVQNHSPQVIVVDEIGTSAKAETAKSTTVYLSFLISLTLCFICFTAISNRGVSMIGTAHGNDIHSLMKNPTLNRLIGGINVVTLGDAAALKAHDMSKGETMQKTKIERAGAPTFNVIIELLSHSNWKIYHNTATAVDNFLASSPVLVENRWRDKKGQFRSRFENTRAKKDQEEGWIEALFKAQKNEESLRNKQKKKAPL